MTILVIRELGAELGDIEGRLVRAFRVLAGEVYPAVQQGVRLVPSPSRDIAHISQMAALYKLFDVLGIPRPVIPTVDVMNGVVSRSASFGLGLLRVALALHPNHRLGNGACGTGFRRIVGLPVPKRYEFVRSEMRSLMSVVRDNVSVLRRFDVRVEDEHGPKLRFDVDAVIDQTHFRGVLRADYSVDPARVVAVEGEAI